MKACAHNEGDVLVVDLSGRVDLETAEPFRHVCLSNLVKKKVIFNLSDLNFVGSNAIVPFLKTMKAYQNRSKATLKMCGVKSEFLRIFAAHFPTGLEVYEDQKQALNSFLIPQPTIPLSQFFLEETDEETPVSSSN